MDERRVGGVQRPHLLRERIDSGWHLGQLPDEVGEDDGADDDDGIENHLRLPHAGELGADQFALAVAHGHVAVVRDRDGQEPDRHPLVAAEDKARLTDHGDVNGLADHAFEPRGDVADDRRVNEAQQEQHDHDAAVPVDQPAADQDVGHGDAEVAEHRGPGRDVAAAGGHRGGPARRLLEGAYLPGGPTQAPVDLPDAGETDGDRDADLETEVEVDPVFEPGGDGGVARRPRMQDARVIQRRVGDHGEDEPDQAPDHGPEGQDHAHDDVAQVPVDARGHRRQVVLRGGGEVGERNGEDLDGLAGDDTGQRRQQQVRPRPRPGPWPHPARRCASARTAPWRRPV